MATDFYGFSRTVNGPDKVASTSMMVVTIDSKLNLAQSVQVTYSRQVTPSYELGSSDVYFIAQPPQGTCEITRMVGDGDILTPYKGGCDTSDIKITNGSGTCGAGPGSVSCKDSILTSVGFSGQVGQFTITDNASYQIGSLSVG